MTLFAFYFSFLDHLAIGLQAILWHDVLHGRMIWYQGQDVIKNQFQAFSYCN